MALAMNQRTWLGPGLHRRFKEIHTDTVLTTNKEYSLDPTTRRIHTDMVLMMNKELF
jgi:hypothetical protein